MTKSSLEGKRSLIIGTFLVASAQGAILLAGFLIHLLLGRWLGPVAYGDFGVLSSLMLINTALFLTGLNRAVSKHIAEGNSPAAAMKAGMQLQVGFGILGFILYFIFAPTLASFLRDPSLSFLIVFSSVAILTQGVHTIYAKGYLNGLHDFRRQAFVEGGMALLKVILAIALVAFGFGVFGAIVAYVLAPLFVLFFVFPLLSQKIKQPASKMALLPFALPITLSFGIFVAAMELGLLAVKAFLPDAASVGLYTAATTIPKILYSLSTAFSLTLLPTVSLALAQKNASLLKQQVQHAIRLSLLFLVPLAIVISLSSSRLMTLLYSSAYQGAGSLLEILIFSAIFFSLFLTINTLLFALGRKVQAIFLSAFLFGGASIGYLFLIPEFSVVGAAWWTVIMGGIGFLASAACLGRVSPLPWCSLVRICSAGGVIFVIGNLVQPHFSLLLLLLLLLFLYICLLIILQEITPEDRALARSLLRRSSRFESSSLIKF